MSKKDLFSSEQRNALVRFFECTRKLKELGIVRSTRYTGDIAEFIVSKVYEIRPCDSATQADYDGCYSINDEKVQIKFHDGPNRTNIPISQEQRERYKKSKVIDLIILLGRNSMIKLKLENEDLRDIAYLIYKIPVKDICNASESSNNVVISTGFLNGYNPEYCFDSSFHLIPYKKPSV